MSSQHMSVFKAFKVLNEKVHQVILFWEEVQSSKAGCDEVLPLVLSIQLFLPYMVYLALSEVSKGKSCLLPL